MKRVVIISFFAGLVLLALLTWQVGSWIYYDEPDYYTKTKEVDVSFEDVKDPKPDCDYFRRFTYHYITKRSDVFPFVHTENVETEYTEVLYDKDCEK